MFSFPAILLLSLISAAPEIPESAPDGPAQEGAAETQNDWGLAQSTRRMLIERCGECHRPDSKNRKARRALQDIGDLAALLAEYVEPGEPEDSELYYSITEGEMPPTESDAKAPSKQELALLHAWIQTGAEPSTDPAANAVQTNSDQPSHKAPIHWTVFVARSHPLWIHFPLALIPVAFLAGVLARLLRKPALRTTALFCLFLAAPASLAAIVSGWMHAAGVGPEAGLNLHRWTGITTGLSCLAALLLCKRPNTFLVCLALGSAAAAAAGHYGGRLTYGADFFPW